MISIPCKQNEARFILEWILEGLYKIVVLVGILRTGKVLALRFEELGKISPTEIKITLRKMELPQNNLKDAVRQYTSHKNVIQVLCESWGQINCQKATSLS